MSTSVRKGGLFARPGRAGQLPILSVSQLSAYYGELRALYDIVFDVNPGEVLAIIGANGAGKTTLLKAIVGMMNRGKTAHITGTIDFQGRRLDKLTTEKIVETGVTMVPEGRMLFSRMTVIENLLVGAYLPEKQPRAKQKLAEMFEFFPRLAERRDQVVSQMSGGEQQMVAIARALMSDPSLVLFDELSLGLAPIILDDIYGKLREINRMGVTCVVIEQDISRALAVANQSSCDARGSRRARRGARQLIERRDHRRLFWYTRYDRGRRRVTDADIYWAVIDILNGLLTGTLIGGYYAMLAIGLALSFGVMRLVNLAHGEFLVIGAYLSAAILQVLKFPPFFVLIIVVPIMFVIGYALQRLLLNRVSDTSDGAARHVFQFWPNGAHPCDLRSSIAISHLLFSIFASDAKTIPNALAFSAIHLTDDLSISLLKFIFFWMTIVLLILLQLFSRQPISGERSARLPTAQLMQP